MTPTPGHMKNYARLPNPPKSSRLTKAWAREVRAVMNELDRRLFTSRKLEMPALHIDQEWIWEMQDRMCAILAQVNVWHDAECRKARKRRKERKEMGDDPRIW